MKSALKPRGQESDKMLDLKLFLRTRILSELFSYVFGRIIISGKKVYRCITMLANIFTFLQ